ncbi:hypothetical protein HDE_01886 [Halotydeus destructor]|nr:hypothetical protein HDE_01886 [Halotydeus destructor]
MKLMVISLVYIVPFFAASVSGQNILVDAMTGQLIPKMTEQAIQTGVIDPIKDVFGRLEPIVDSANIPFVDRIKPNPVSERLVFSKSEFSDHWFSYIPKSKTYNDAIKLCQEHNATLPVLGSRYEQKWLVHHLTSSQPFWLWSSKSPRTSIFESWGSGVPFTFTDWYPGEPQDPSTCSAIFVDSNSWFDCNCNKCIKTVVCMRETNYEPEVEGALAEADAPWISKESWFKIISGVITLLTVIALCCYLKLKMRRPPVQVNISMTSLAEQGMTNKPKSLWTQNPTRPMSYF